MSRMLGQVDKPELGETRRGIPGTWSSRKGKPSWAVAAGGRGVGWGAACRGARGAVSGLERFAPGGDTADYIHQTSLTLQSNGSISAHGRDSCRKLI